jgi:3-dehydroquinate synthase
MKVPVIGACLKAENNTFWSIEVRKGLEDEAKNKHFILKYQTPEQITEISKQKKIIEGFIKQNVDAIILAPSDPSALIPQVKKANQVRIPIVIIDTELNEKEAKKQGITYTFLGFDDYTGGFTTGKLLKERLKKGEKVAIIHGPSQGSYTRRVDGFKDAVKDSLDVVAVASAAFEEDRAYAATQELISHYKNLRAIFCTSDNMAMGCLTALYELGREDILVSGFDATHAGHLALSKGRLISTVDTKPEEMGRRAISLAQELLEYPTPQIIRYPISLLTKEKIQPLPKQVIQKRTYVIVKPTSDLREFPYQELHNSLQCPVIIGNNMVNDLPSRLKTLRADKYIIITDDIVEKIYGTKLKNSLLKKGLRTSLYSFPSGEKNKTFTVLNDLATRVLDEGISKKSCLVLVGGGIVGNLAGFLAAILMRGIRFVHVPTTVMSQIDSTTGGKQAVNMPHGKNLLGTFYEPEFIYIDLTTINTLPSREYRSGIAEAIKHGFCQSKELLAAVEKKDYAKIVEKTILLKTNIIDIDPREKNEGLILVYGHTIGHAIETASNHTLNHGEAISIGMVAAARISNQLGFCNKDCMIYHEKILKKQGLPVRIPLSLSVESIMAVLPYDKKERQANIPFALIEDIGKMKKIKNSFSVPVENKVIREVLLSMRL